MTSKEELEIVKEYGRSLDIVEVMDWSLTHNKCGIKLAHILIMLQEECQKKFPEMDAENFGKMLIAGGAAMAAAGNYGKRKEAQPTFALDLSSLERINPKK